MDTTEHEAPATDMLSEHGMRCPDCGQAERFLLEFTGNYPLNAFGGNFNFLFDGKFNDDNPCICESDDCGTWQTVGYFRVKAKSGEDDILISKAPPTNITGGMDSVEYVHRIRSGELLEQDAKIERLEKELAEQTSLAEQRIAIITGLDDRERVSLKKYMAEIKRANEFEYRLKSIEHKERDKKGLPHLPMRPRSDIDDFE